MEKIEDFNKDGKIDWKDWVFYSITIVGNVLFTVLNIIR